MWGVGVYLSVQRGGVRESGWEGGRQLGGVERVRGPHVRAARVEGRACELICGEKKKEEDETEKRKRRRRRGRRRRRRCKGTGVRRWSSGKEGV